MLVRRALPRLQQPFRPHPHHHRFLRLFSTTELGNGITLAYDLHEPPAKANSGLRSLRENAPPIVFLHGLFGSKKNNRSMSRVFARDLNRPVYALDLRNHGDSTHDPQHNYTALAEDVELFLQHHRMEKVTLIGHSMGAKTAMAVALRNKSSIADLIPIDNAPVDAALTSDFPNYVQAMRRIEEAQTRKQSDADTILQDYEKSLPIRQFLLTNLTKTPEGIQRFRIPMRYLASALTNLGDFPFKDPDEARYEGPTLIVRGTRSHYVADEMLPIVGRFFPKFELCDIDSGHWVVSERPEEFRKAVVDFLQDKE